MPDHRPRIALLTAPSTSAAVLYGLYDVLMSAGAVFPDMTLGKPGTEALDIRIVSLDGQAFRCLGNVLVEPHHSIADLGPVDAVVICDMYSSIHQPPREDYAAFSCWLTSLHSDGVLLTSVCSGALVLAEAGLLNGREAASHWAYAELFSRVYPLAKLRRDSILCLSAEAQGIVTAGGVTSWQELALYLIARFCGAPAARETAKVHLLAGHEGGQLPFAAINRCRSSSDRIIARCQEWVALNYQEANPVQRMVEIAGLNTRTFARRFRAATGNTPIDYVQQVRIEEAKQMLETTAHPIDDLSNSVGYLDPAAFRRTFRKLAGMTPAEYRRRFANPVPSN
ncbi:GlxA family transcriptional regulator [Tabrizicola sp.]|uniref:GlxA family transcriptional regulator n=1 Tax=Tabrizicola sp. TaxID=2005166 RepID=UPI0025F57FD0|nr:helix-turn-helix domain-containing protein [Tabrizicola sp.]